MTKEERAEKWFHSIPEAEALDLQVKMEICNRAAVRMALIFFGLFLVECALFFLVNDGEIFNRAADFINTLSEGSHTRAQRRGVAFTGALICLPLIIVPALTAVVFKNRYIKSEAAKALMPR